MTTNAARLDPNRQPIDALMPLRRRMSVPPGRRIDVLIAGLLMLATFFVHDFRYVLSAPFWNDEFWVAISTKLPLSDLLRVTSSSPPGWTLLLRWVPFGYPERIRIVPLIFAAFTVVAAYVYARTLPWPSALLQRLAGTLAGVAALLVPSALIRNDLKQYTTDAFVTLVTLWLVSRAEHSWSRPEWSRRLIQLAVFISVAFFFSTAAILVGAAALGSVLLAVLLRCDWPKLLATLVVSSACAACLVGTYLVVYRPGAPPGLTQYWSDYYMPVAGGAGASWDFFVRAQQRLVNVLGLGPVLIVVALLTAGVTTLVLLHRIACALLVPILVMILVAASAARQYPLFDVRTSHFLAVAVVVTAAVGGAGICTFVSRRHAAIGVAAAVCMVCLFVTGTAVRTNIRSHSIPAEDLGTPTAYIATHAQPGDTVVVAMISSWGFAYYWPRGEPGIAPVTSNLQQFITVFPDQPNILVAQDGERAGIDDALSRAVARATGPDGNGRIWFVHVHVRPAELAQYRAWVASRGVQSAAAIPPSLELLTVLSTP